MSETKRSYRIGFKDGTSIDIQCLKIQNGNIFGKQSLVVSDDKGESDLAAFLPLETVSYVVPLEYVIGG